MEIAIFIITLLLLLIIGTHIGVALGASALIILLLYQDTSLDIIAQQTFQSANSYAIAAIPFFILAGDIIMKGDLAKRVLDFTDIALRKVHGGTAIAAMFVSVFFSAVSGSSAASAAAIGKNLVQVMGERGYPKRFIAGLVATGGTLGLLIPPSLSFILIGSMIGVPIIDLFTAGIVPGVMQAIMLIILTWWLCKRNNWERVSQEVSATAEPVSPIEKVSKPDTIKQLKSSSGVLLLPVLILGGIYLGFFTPTEVSAVAVVYAAILAVFVYKAIKVKDLWKVSKGALLQSGMIYLILIGGALTAFMLKSLGLTTGIITMIADLGLEPWQFLLIVNILLLILGLFWTESPSLRCYTYTISGSYRFRNQPDPFRGNYHDEYRNCDINPSSWTKFICHEWTNKIANSGSSKRGRSLLCRHVWFSIASNLYPAN